MAWFKIYADSCNGATFIRTDEFENAEEAMKAAYQEAVTDYQSYEGYHGLLDREQYREDLLDSFGYATEEDIDDYYQEKVESWIQYYVRPANGSEDVDDSL